MSWQPIETAPRNGSEIDIWVKTHDSQKRITDVRWDNDSGDFIDRQFNRVSDKFAITHWMPKPLWPGEVNIEFTYDQIREEFRENSNAWIDWDESNLPMVMKDPHSGQIEINIDGDVTETQLRMILQLMQEIK